jgi:hypothetical protein
MNNNGLIDALTARIRLESDMPKGYEMLTNPIDLETEESIVESIYRSLRNTEFLVTMDNGQVVFWRKLKQVAEPGRRLAKAA